MNAAIVSNFKKGPAYGEIATPEPGDGELLVHVHAAAQSPLTKMRAAGKHYSSVAEFPFVPGEDGVGLLEDGTRVYFFAPGKRFGSMAELASVASDAVLPIPHELDDVTAAALANPGMSSWAALSERAHFQAGEWVLVNGATGAAGRLAVQIAKCRGAATIVATGRNPDDLAALPGLGADVVIPVDQPKDALADACAKALRGLGSGVVLDYLWGPSAEALVAGIVRHEQRDAAAAVRYVSIGSLAGETIKMPSAALRGCALEVMGSGVGSVPKATLAKAIGAMFEAAVPGKFTVAAQAVPLRDVATAWNAPAGGKRLVFIP